MKHLFVQQHSLNENVSGDFKGIFMLNSYTEKEMQKDHIF